MDDIRTHLPLSPQQFHILVALVEGPRHGYGLILDIEAATGGAMRLGTGTLYTAIARLLTLGFVDETDRGDARRRFYRITARGRAVLKAETSRLEALVRHARHHGIQPARLKP